MRGEFVVKKKAGVLLSVCMAFLMVFSSASYAASEWQPTRPITLIAPFGPGSGGDNFSRRFAEIMSRYAGVSVVVENMAGGSGNIGTMAMLSRPADGYTFSYHSNTGALNTASGNAPFGVDDVLPIANISADYHTISARSDDSRFNTFEDMVKFAHENPGELRIGGSQVLGNNHIFALLIMQEFEIDATYIPYDDGAASILAMLGGNFDVLVNTNSLVVPYLENGDFRALAYTFDEPLEEHGDVPTFADLGSPALAHYRSFRGMFINPNVPPEVRRWYDEIGYKVVHDPEWQDFMRDMGQVDSYMDMSTFTEFYRRYVEEAKELIASLTQ